MKLGNPITSILVVILSENLISPEPDSSKPGGNDSPQFLDPIKNSR